MKHPKGLYLLNFVSMWECFSYYGMMGLMVLYLTSEWGLSDSSAFSLYALYIACVEFGGLLGGFCADRFLGFRGSIILGGWSIVCGHLCLTLGDQSIFIVGLSLIISGTAFFRGNLAALVSSLYQPDDPLLESGYRLYYIGINVGSLLASVCCPLLAEAWNWEAGFGCAAIGMFVGNCVFLCGQKQFLKDSKCLDFCNLLKGAAILVMMAITVALGLHFVETTETILPLFEVLLLIFAFRKLITFSSFKQIAPIFGAILAIIIFYGCEELLGSSLVLFAERHVNRLTPFGSIPSTSLVTFNPLAILIIGLFATKIQKDKTNSNRSLIIGFAALSFAFAVLSISPFFASPVETVELPWMIISILLIGAAEVWVGPTVYTIAAKAAPQNHQGLVMGIVTMGFSLANVFSGFLSKTMAMDEKQGSLTLYTQGFTNLALLAISVTIGVYLIYRINLKIALNIKNFIYKK